MRFVGGAGAKGAACFVGCLFEPNKAARISLQAGRGGAEHLTRPHSCSDILIYRYICTYLKSGEQFFFGIQTGFQECSLLTSELLVFAGAARGEHASFSQHEKVVNKKPNQLWRTCGAQCYREHANASSGMMPPCRYNCHHVHSLARVQFLVDLTHWLSCCWLQMKRSGRHRRVTINSARA